MAEPDRNIPVPSESISAAIARRRPALVRGARPAPTPPRTRTRRFTGAGSRAEVHGQGRDSAVREGKGGAGGPLTGSVHANIAEAGERAAQAVESRAVAEELLGRPDA